VLIGYELRHDHRKDIQYSIRDAGSISLKGKPLSGLYLRIIFKYHLPYFLHKAHGVRVLSQEEPGTYEMCKS